jgi:hypothetical protein
MQHPEKTKNEKAPGRCRTPSYLGLDDRSQGRFLASVKVQSAIGDVAERFRRFPVGIASADTDVFQHSIVELHQRAPLASHRQSRAEMGDPGDDLTDEIRDRTMRVPARRLMDNCGLHGALSFGSALFHSPVYGT